MMRRGISAVIMTFNEEQTIGKALSSLSGIADQIVIVDTGSTDTTLVIARTHPSLPEIHIKEWQHNFSAIRNYALSLCLYTCCIVLDGDEYIEKTCGIGVRKIIEDKMLAEPYALYAPLIDNLNGDFLRNNPRIFMRRKTLKYLGRVHEYLSDCKPVPLIELHDVVIKHTGYQKDIYEKKQKKRRNIELLRLQIAEEPDNYRWKYFMLRYISLYSEEALSLLQEFADLSLPYPYDIEVYAFNAKTRYIHYMLEKKEWENAFKHASNLYTHYRDVDTTQLYIATKLGYSSNNFFNEVRYCKKLLDISFTLDGDEYLHEKINPELIRRLREDIVILSETLTDYHEK